MWGARGAEAMIRVVVLEPLAARELREAAPYYERKAVRVGSVFVDEVELVFGAIAESTTSGMLVPGVQNDLPIRRAFVARFPYAVVFVERTDTIHVIAVAHLRRRPNYWLGRIKRGLSR